MCVRGVEEREVEREESERCMLEMRERREKGRGREERNEASLSPLFSFRRPLLRCLKVVCPCGKQGKKKKERFWAPVQFGIHVKCMK